MPPLLFTFLVKGGGWQNNLNRCFSALTPLKLFEHEIFERWKIIWGHRRFTVCCSEKVPVRNSAHKHYFQFRVSFTESHGNLPQSDGYPPAFFIPFILHNLQGPPILLLFLSHWKTHSFLQKPLQSDAGNQNASKRVDLSPNLSESI